MTPYIYLRLGYAQAPRSLPQFVLYIYIGAVRGVMNQIPVVVDNMICRLLQNEILEHWG